jgi:hypothetical protein
MRRKLPKLIKINTKYLAQIVATNYSTTDAGTDYGHLIDEVEQELTKRQNAQAEKDLSKFLREQEKALQNEGKQCPQCLNIHTTIADIEANFHKVSGKPNKFRPLCKKCTTINATMNRLKRTTEIPF